MPGPQTAFTNMSTRGAGDSIKPGVERSVTPGTRHQTSYQARESGRQRRKSRQTFVVLLRYRPLRGLASLRFFGWASATGEVRHSSSQLGSGYGLC